MDHKEEVDISKKWQCQKCGKCCQGIVNVKDKGLSIIRNSKIMCRFFDHVLQQCTNYTKRPLICKIYPFYIDMKDQSVFEAVKPENLKIDKHCLGVGMGKKIHGNKKLLKHLDDIAQQVSKIERKSRKTATHLKHKI